jgi:hypothetical protein
MQNRVLSLLLVGMILLAAPDAAFNVRASEPKTRNISYEEARPILAALNEVLPAELRAASPMDLPAVWANWVVRRDAEIRARLGQGDEDSLINFLLFGTSFTHKPRITLDDLARAGSRQVASAGSDAGEGQVFIKAIQTRADDLIQAMAAPGKNERLLFARRLIDERGYSVNDVSGRERVKQYLLANLARVLGEHASYSRVLESARLLGDPSAEFAERSKLYATRGLSSDTSLLPNFAIERALTSIKAQGLLAAGSVRRVGIVGPGLDFTDKQDGYDFYPQQTIQPFAIIDTLLRLGLARAADLRVTTLDLSPRINDHLTRARARAAAGYVVQLPRDPQGRWKPESISYWSRFGDHIGTPVPPVAAPVGTGEVKVRAVRVRPAIVSIVNPADVNIVLQRLDLQAANRFDLIIATNILVYYEVFEQSLAFANIEGMVRPGGFLLSNNALLELPSGRMHSAGYETVVYSDRPNDGDHIVWYQRSSDN